MSCGLGRREPYGDRVEVRPGGRATEPHRFDKHRPRTAERVQHLGPRGGERFD